MTDRNSNLAALKAAFPHTLPVLAGFMFLGITYGVLMNTSGFPFWYPIIISLSLFAGSAQFVAVNILLGAFNPLQAFAMILMINARHLFYGLSMLEKYKGVGLKKLYLIFGMCDETFSINCSVDVPEGIDRGKFYLATTLLDQAYWVAGTAIGAIFGSFITFSTEGLDFAMTAMFVVIFVEQLRSKENILTCFAGLFVSLLCLIIFGRDAFLIPAMIAILLFLSALQFTGKGGESL